MIFTVSLSRKVKQTSIVPLLLSTCTKLGLNFRLIIMLTLYNPYLCIKFTLTSLINNLQSKDSTHSQWFVIKDARFSKIHFKCSSIHEWPWQNYVSVTKVLHLSSNDKVEESKSTCHLKRRRHSDVEELLENVT